MGKTKWKKVDEELPIQAKQVLIRCEDNICWVGRLRGAEWWANGWGAITTKVTHWSYIDYPTLKIGEK